MTETRLKQIPKLAALIVLTVIFAALSRYAVAQTISVKDAYQLEGTEATASEQDFLFFIDISGTINSPITLNWSTRDIDAQSNTDYEAVSDGKLILMPGDQFLTGDNRRKIAVKVFNDDSFEEDESFELVVTTDSNLATISNSGGVVRGHILNEDGTRVSIGSFEGSNNTIKLELNFDPPLRFPFSPDQSNEFTLELPISIRKNSDIIFTEQNNWNTVGQQEISLKFDYSDMGSDDNIQNFVEAYSKSIEVGYAGDQGTIDFEIVGNDFFQPDLDRYNLPAISARTSCSTKIACQVRLTIPGPDPVRPWHRWGYHNSEIGLFMGLVGLGLAIFLSFLSRKNARSNTATLLKDSREGRAEVREHLATLLEESRESREAFIANSDKNRAAAAQESKEHLARLMENSDKNRAAAAQESKEHLARLMEESKESRDAVIQNSNKNRAAVIKKSEENTDSIKEAVNSSSEKISREIQSLPEKIVEPLSKEIQSSSKAIVGAIEKYGIPGSQSEKIKPSKTEKSPVEKQPAPEKKTEDKIKTRQLAKSSPSKTGVSEAKPAVPITESVKEDYIVCLEDGKKFKTLKRHIKTHYNLSPEQYRLKWGLPKSYPMVAPSYAISQSALAKRNGNGRKSAR